MDDVTNVWLQYTDEAMTEPCGWSYWPQPYESWPYQKEISVSSAEYLAYYNSQMPWDKPVMPAPVTGE